MRKLLIIILVALMPLSFAACSAPAENVRPSASTGTAKDMTSPDDAIIFGRVTAVVGNQLTLDISKTPQYYLEGKNPEDGDIMSQTSDGNILISGSGKAEAGSGSGKSGEDSKAGQGDLPNIEFEYTGGSRTLTIPEGLDIGDMSGNEYKLSDLKEDDKLLISIGPDGENFAFILILE